MREEREPITFLEEGYDSMSRYSKDGKYAYSIPEDGISYGLRSGCAALELKGRESMIHELILPTSFCSFNKLNFAPFNNAFVCIAIKP